MDFLSRLIGGVGAAQSRKSSSNNPQQRLARFKKTYSQGLQLWHKVSASKPDAATTESIRACFQRLTTYLHDDTRAPSPHLCLSFAASSQIYIPISQIALSMNSEDIIREAVAWFSALVDSDEENLLSNERFAETLMTFVDGIIGTSGFAVGSQTEGEILELIFGIAAKLRLETELLPVWFVPDTRPGAQREASYTEADSPIITSKKSFPLCYQFIGHVYHEGRAGDFARTGLLYIFESASHSSDLEEWIVSSDLPTLMASGLGALYSQLSRKLSIAHEKSSAPLILALSDSDSKIPSADADSFFSEDLQSRLTTFMSNLVFWQDILEHCRSREIRQTLIDHFQIFFLQQILYPSLLESSDIDGGSSVAVLTYIWRILDSLEHPDLVNLILGYLLALQEPLTSRPTTAISPMAEKRKQSLLSLPGMNGEDDSLTPKFFSLVDLILTSVQSSNWETVTCALRLISVIHGKHHGFAYTALMRSTTLRISEFERNLGSFMKETEYFLWLARAIGGEDGMDEAYENCLKDGLGSIETHICSLSHPGVFGAGPGLEGKVKGQVYGAPSKAIQVHSLVPEDPILNALMDLLKTFFTNDVETNLGLTNVIANLASCPYTTLEGWLISNPSKNENRLGDTALPNALVDDDNEAGESELDMEEAEKARTGAFKAACQRPIWSIENGSPLLKTMHLLQQQSEKLRADVDNFDHLLAGRKRAFEGATEIENEIKTAAPLLIASRASPASSRASSRSRATPRESKKPGLAVASPSTPASLVRGRAISAIAGKPRPLSPSALNRSTQPMSIPRTGHQKSPSSHRISLSPTKASRTLSPLKFAMNAADNEDEDEKPFSPGSGGTESSMEEMFERKIKFPKVIRSFDPSSSKEAGEEGDESSDETTEEAEMLEATLSHVLTNVVILQEFILEITALVQVRASLLEGEINFGGPV